MGKRNVTGGKGFCKKEFFYRSAHRISYITTKQSYAINKAKLRNRTWWQKVPQCRAY